MRIYPGLLIVFSVLVSFAQQSTDYIIIDAPVGVISADSLVWIKWTVNPEPDISLLIQVLFTSVRHRREQHCQL